ncbi:alpha/beta fold hydrolase [Micromonospora echinofusca]|uniref:alpha/beta fold hydrolase n=1 Tax=Micromonospora echinofusca TaxID=47858 RepID=UPI0027DD18DD|nr:alpha/beta hydrolase [Micromonospora echinofusca]
MGEENGIPIDLHYEDYGDGRPVVLVHGWPLGGQAWEHQLPPLVDAGYRVITYDRRGSGRSAQPWHGYDYDTLAADLHALITRLDLVDLALVSASTGSGQVARFVRTYGQDRLRRLVFVSAPPPYLRNSYDNPDGRFDDSAIEQLTSAIRQDRLAFLDHEIRTAFRAGAHDNLISDVQHAYHVSIAAADSPKATLDFLLASIRTDFRPDLPHITMPALVVHGCDDAVFPAETPSHQVHRSLHDSRLVVLPGAPHALTITHPDVFNRTLLAFLND